MKTAIVLLLLLAANAGACRSEEKPAAGDEARAPGLPPAMRALRLGIEAEMKALLYSVRDAEERAAEERGRYVDWPELRRSYYPDPIPGHLDVRMPLSSSRAYRLEVTHKATGIRCVVSMGTGTNTDGAPRCR